MEAFEARDRVGRRIWSVPFAGSTAERGAEFILPGESVLIATARGLGLQLVRKGTHYGEREPRGGEQVTSAEMAAATQRISASTAGDGDTAVDALGRLRLRPAVAEAIRSRVEVSCAHSAEDLDGSVLRSAAAFGDFDSFRLEGGNDSLRRALADQLGDRVHVGAPVKRVTSAGREQCLFAGEIQAAAEAVVIAVPPTVIDSIDFDPPLPGAKLAALRGLAPWTGGEAVHRPALADTAERDAVGSGALLVLHTAGRGRGAAAVRWGVRGHAPRDRGARRRGGTGRWPRSLRSGSISTSTRTPCCCAGGTMTRGCAAHTRPLRSGRRSGRAIPAIQWVGRFHFAGEHTAGELHGLMEGALVSGDEQPRKSLAGGSTTRL